MSCTVADNASKRRRNETRALSLMSTLQVNSGTNRPEMNSGQFSSPPIVGFAVRIEHAFDVAI